jgi:hypothetical protein
MGKSMIDLQDNGKQVTTLGDTDLLLATTDPAGTPDDAVIEWGDLKALVGGGDVIRTKYIITPSVASNNLTVAIKYIDGADPSTTNLLTFRVGNTEYNLTTSASITKNAGTNWCNSGASLTATKEIDYFVYAIGETGASAGLKFGFSRIPYAITMSDFVNTSTDNKYIAGNWTNFNATDKVEVIGRFNATLSAGAGYTWSIPATPIVIHRPIYMTRQLDYVPAVSALSGSITSVTVNSAQYTLHEKQMYLFVDVSITNNGTGADAVIYTHPLTIPDQLLLAREYTAGFFCYGATQSGNIYLRKYDETYPGATGRRIKTAGWVNVS